MNRMRLKRLWLWVAAVVLLLLLAMSISQIEFSYGAGEQIFNFAAWVQRGRESQGFEAGPTSTVFVVLLRVILWVLLPIAIVYTIVRAILRREGRWQVIAYVAAFVLLLLAVLIWGGLPVEEEVEIELTPVAAEPPVSATPGEVPLPEPPQSVEQSPDWLVWVITVVVAVVLVVGGWYTLRRLRRPSRPLQRLALQAQEAVEQVRAGRDLRDVVLRSYLEMSRILSDSRGIRRGESMTPREFELRLQKEGLPETDVRRLTRLFEGVRYGAKTAGLVEQQEAIACLTAIVQACERAS